MHARVQLYVYTPETVVKVALCMQGEITGEVGDHDPVWIVDCRIDFKLRNCW